MRILKANTAVRLVVGPLCDKTTGLAKTGMTVTNMAMNMWHEHDDGSAPTKSIDAVAFTASGGSNDMVELAGGYYDIEITAAQLNITAGRALFCIYDDDVILPYCEEWLVVPANVFDSIMGTDTLDVMVTGLADDVITAAKFDESTAFPVKSADTGSTAIARVGADSDTLETLSDQMDAVKTETAGILADTGTDGVLLSSGTGAKQISLSSGAVLLQATQTGVTIPTVTAITNGVTLADDAITAAKFDESTAFPIKSADSMETILARKGDAMALVDDAIVSGKIEAGALADVADAVLDEAMSGHVSAGTLGKAVADILEDTGTTLDTLVKDIPTNAELATALGTADDAVLAAVAAAKTVIDDIHNTDLPAVKAETALIVEDTGTTLPATLASILEDTGTTLPAAIIAGSAGSGATAKTYTVTVNGQPVSGVHVLATTDLAGANIVASGYTNDSGVVIFYLDSGTTYHMWRQHKDYTFINPDTEVA